MSISQEASERVRESILAGKPLKQREAIARILVEQQYGLDKGVLVDTENRIVRFGFSEGPDMFETDLPAEADVIVFVEAEKLVGWMPRREVDQIPDSFGVISHHYFYQMPVEWNFSVPCEVDPCDAPGIWDYSMDAWECFHCPRYRLDESTRKLDDHLGRSD